MSTDAHCTPAPGAGPEFPSYLNQTTRHGDIPTPAVNSPPPGHELAGLHDDAG